MNAAIEELKRQNAYYAKLISDCKRMNCNPCINGFKIIRL